MLGSYLYQVSTHVPTLVYTNGPSLTIIPDKINYLLNEPVHIRIINSGTTRLQFEDSSFGLKVRGLDGTVIFVPPSGKSGAFLDPHEEKVFVWNQTRTGGAKVFEGRYVIDANTLPVGGEELKKSVTINIFQ